MSEPTKPIAFRVSQSIEAEIQKVAEANGQTKSDWVRDQVMLALHNLQSDVDPQNNDSKTELLAGIEGRLDAIQSSFRAELAAVKAAISDAATSHHNDLCAFVQVGISVEESIEQKIEDACFDLFDAMERLKQSQRSHKDTLLQELRREYQ